jgi:hypothetical protein
VDILMWLLYDIWFSLASSSKSIAKTPITFFYFSISSPYRLLFPVTLCKQVTTIHKA